MKKIFAFIILAALFAVPVYAQYAETPEYNGATEYAVTADYTEEITEAAVRVTVNGTEIYFDVPPVVIGGRALVPVRAVFEYMGFEVLWHAQEQRVELSRRTAMTEPSDVIGIYHVVEIVIGDSHFLSIGEIFPLDVPARIIGGRTMLPIRAVAESVGYYVHWDRWSGTVKITSEPYEPGPIILPPRELTESEVALWIAEYHEHGGATHFEREVIRLTNIERERHGLHPVEEYATLMLASRFKAQSMYDLNYFAHTSPVYGHFANIARNLFAKPLRTMGENLGNGHQTPEAVVTAWMESPSHRDNILSPNYTRIGVGFHNYRWAQKFSG